MGHEPDFHKALRFMPHLPLANISQVPCEIVSIILSFLFDDGIGHRSGPGGILDDGCPCPIDRSYFARTVVHINRVFNSVATRLLWTRVTVDTVDQLKYLGLATSDNPSLGTLTRRLDIQVNGPVNLALLNRLLQYMRGLETIAYSTMLRACVTDRTSADVVIDSLSRFCPSLRNVVFMTHHDLSPTPQSLWNFLRTQENLEVLHVDDVCPKFNSKGKGYYDRSIPKIPRRFKARSLRILSLGDCNWMGGEGWSGEGGVASEFWGGFPAKAFPRLEKLCCLAFTPKLLPFVSRQSTSIRHLTVTSYNKSFYVSPNDGNRKNILDAAVDTVHLTWRVDFLHGIDIDSLKAWQPLPKSHRALQRITILPEGYLCTRHSHLGRVLKQILSAIVEADLPRLALVEIDGAIARREDIASSGWFLRLLRELENQKRKNIVVQILETGVSSFPWALEAPGYSSDVSL